ncbi:MAG: TIGR00730 family Rossman fold protein [Crocinitomicaceae bacterium]|nr:TIGR00730 family Rossman fold protein [Crocinitomicaceae bacterium]
MQVCVYCASSGKIHPEYFKATARMAKDFVKNDVSVVFGGGSSGLMGQLADAVLEEGGKIKGIMPQFMNEVEWGHRGVSDFIYTQTMHERKSKFLEGTDALVALPGGTGTYEELFEAITLKKLGQFTKPIIILNTRGYYEPFRLLMEHTIREQFMADDHQDIWQIVNEPEEVLPAILKTKTWEKGLKDAGKMR